MIIKQLAALSIGVKALSGAGASKKLGAFRFKLRLKPPPLLMASPTRRGPGRPAFRQVPRGESEVISVPHSHASASRYPSALTDTPINWLHSETNSLEFQWHPSPTKVTAIKKRFLEFLCSESQGWGIRGQGTGGLRPAPGAGSWDLPSGRIRRSGITRF